MHRWIARLLVFVMVVPALAPLAMAAAVPQTGPHCLRQPAKPAMECHPGMKMAMAPDPSSPETSFQAANSCCQNHDCCRGMASPKWAQPASHLLAHQALPVALATRQTDIHFIPGTLSDVHSARAPPLT